MEKADSRDLEAVIAGCKRRDSESFSRLIDAYSTRLYGFFYRLSGDRTVSDDLLSELFVKLVEKIRHYRGGHFEGWLFTVASNIWHDWLRARQRDDKALEARQEELELGAKLKRLSGLEADVIDRLGRELENIDQQSRELIMLRYYSQMSFKEIAQMQAMPIGTVLSKVHRGLARLRELMSSPNAK
jgi:RNA polymerase sigma-70 factor (ECF subfamily)